MKNVNLLVVILILFLTTGGTAIACGGGGGGGGGGGADMLPPDSHFDPADPHNLGVEDEDGLLQTIDEIYRKGLKKKQAQDMAESKKWIDEGNYYENLEKKGKNIQTGANVAGNVIDIFTGGAGSKINNIGQNSAIFIQTTIESKQKGKSTTQALEDAAIKTGKNITKINTLEKILKTTPNIKPPPAVDLGTPLPDHSFGAGGPAPLDENVFNL